MMAKRKQWIIGIAVSVISGLLGILITVLTWQHPKSPSDSPSVLEYENAASHAVESYFRNAKCEEVDNKYVRTFTLTSKSSEGWVDTGIVLRRNRRIFIRRNGEEDGQIHSNNYWAISTNDPERSISDRWDDHGGNTDINTNDILGDKKQDTLKIAAYWEDQEPITIDVIIDWDKYVLEYSCESE
jgi:hypothetical protein